MSDQQSSSIPGSGACDTTDDEQSIEDLKGVGSSRAFHLKMAGFDDPSDIASSSIEELVEVHEIGHSRANKLQERAAALFEDDDDVVGSEGNEESSDDEIVSGDRGGSLIVYGSEERAPFPIAKANVRGDIEEVIDGMDDPEFDVDPQAEFERMVEDFHDAIQACPVKPNRLVTHERSAWEPVVKAWRRVISEHTDYYPTIQVLEFAWVDWTTQYEEDPTNPPHEVRVRHAQEKRHCTCDKEADVQTCTRTAEDGAPSPGDPTGAGWKVMFANTEKAMADHGEHLLVMDDHRYNYTMINKHSSANPRGVTFEFEQSESVEDFADSLDLDTQDRTANTDFWDHVRDSALEVQDAFHQGPMDQRDDDEMMGGKGVGKKDDNWA